MEPKLGMLNFIERMTHKSSCFNIPLYILDSNYIYLVYLKETCLRRLTMNLEYVPSLKLQHFSKFFFMLRQSYEWKVSAYKIHVMSCLLKKGYYIQTHC